MYVTPERQNGFISEASTFPFTGAEDVSSNQEKTFIPLLPNFT